MRKNRADYSEEGWRQHILCLNRKKRQRLKDRQAVYRKRSREKYKMLLALGLAKPHESESSEYNAWHSMIARCHRKSSQYYRHYGGRGIKVCQRWRASYEAFLHDMGRRPHGLELDRIDNDGDYAPGNCRWATAVENMRNRRCTRRLTFNGETKCLIEWAESHGLSYSTLKDRLERGWSAEKALTTKVGRSNE